MNEKPVEIKLPANLFQGKTAIITGASRGVGRATALRLAESGANVVVNYLSAEEKANNVVALCKEKGVDAIAVQGDVSVWQDAQNLAHKAIEKFGKIDLLVLNAGIWEGALRDGELILTSQKICLVARVNAPIGCNCHRPQLDICIGRDPVSRGDDEWFFG